MPLGVLDFPIHTVAGGLRLLVTQPEVLKRLANAPAGSQPGKNRTSGDVRIPSPKVRRKTSGRDILAEFQIRICRQRSLIPAPQTVCGGMQTCCKPRMVSKYLVRFQRVLLLQTCPIEAGV